MSELLAVNVKENGGMNHFVIRPIHTSSHAPPPICAPTAFAHACTCPQQPRRTKQRLRVEVGVWWKVASDFRVSLKFSVMWGSEETLPLREVGK